MPDPTQFKNSVHLSADVNAFEKDRLSIKNPLVPVVIFSDVVLPPKSTTKTIEKHEITPIDIQNLDSPYIQKSLSSKKREKFIICALLVSVVALVILSLIVFQIGFPAILAALALAKASSAVQTGVTLLVIGTLIGSTSIPVYLAKLAVRQKEQTKAYDAILYCISDPKFLPWVYEALSHIQIIKEEDLSVAARYYQTKGRIELLSSQINDPRWQEHEIDTANRERSNVHLSQLKEELALLKVEYQNLEKQWTKIVEFERELNAIEPEESNNELP